MLSFLGDDAYNGVKRLDMYLGVFSNVRDRDWSLKFSYYVVIKLV